MKKLKIVRVVLLVILVIVIVAVVAVHLFADQALKAAIEKAATKTLQVGVSVGDVDLSILGGRIGFQNLLIDNPPGYEHDRLLDLKDAQIAVNVKSLLSDVVNIREIKLDGINLVLEQKGLTDNNLNDVMKNIPSGPKAEPKKPGKKLHIDNLEISNVTVKVKMLPVPGKADTVTLNLSPIRMTNLGTDNKLDAAALSGKVLLAIASGIAKEGVGVLPDNILNPMKSALGKAADLGKTATKETKELIDKGKDVGTGIFEGLKGLIKPEEKE
ncbi:MAG: DUF748 domain-containing protein [Planctomycetota bacterium]